LTDAEAALARLPDDGLLDAAVVVHDANGRLQLRQTHDSSVGDDAVAGGTVGLLAGLLLGLPVAGAVIGLVAGGGWGARDTGIDDELLKRLGDELEGGNALVVALTSPEARRAVVETLAGQGGVVVDTDTGPAP
jgi:uncharacterized membrane protein